MVFYCRMCQERREKGKLEGEGRDGEGEEGVMVTWRYAVNKFMREAFMMVSCVCVCVCACVCVCVCVVLAEEGACTIISSCSIHSLYGSCTCDMYIVICTCTCIVYKVGGSLAYIFGC